ncbi:glycerate kinase [Sporosarcina obsidiansis]|uniref:glycerate kinase n=1 Tax=Sporosarcina obsidiansis TaxID=2660748 RepID=UPI00129ACE98|nr:glycerate kinase [Sporosarcina obsidiansis]
MKVIIAPDAFKGSLTADEAANAMQIGIQEIFPEAETVCLPVADGGEGTLSALVSATSGAYKTFIVRDPLGRPIEAQLGILGDGETAVVELAQASGLTLLAPDELNPMRTSTYGTGELIRHALDIGFRKLIIGLGGSATNDGGTGLLEALGVSFFDNEGRLLQMNGASLLQIDKVDMSHLDPRVKATDIRIASDVENPFIGEKGASYIFGPQKGADAQSVKLLDKGMRYFADETEHLTGVRLHELRGAGAAGGSAGALIAYCDARLESGIDVVLEAMNFSTHLPSADIIFTGEGKTDLQTLDGKALMGVARLAKSYQVPVFVISGAIEEGARIQLDEWFTELHALDDGSQTLAELMTNASELLSLKTEILMKTFEQSS